MDKIGPICRGVEDCAAALHATYGPDERDLNLGMFRLTGCPRYPSVA